jgi:hypothetical protein
MGGGGRQEFMGALHYERYGLADMGVYISHLEGRCLGLALGVVEDLQRGHEGV